MFLKEEIEIFENPYRYSIAPLGDLLVVWRLARNRINWLSLKISKPTLYRYLYSSLIGKQHDPNF